MSKAVKVISREYKVMLDARAFLTPAAVLEEFWDDLNALAKTTGVEAGSAFDATKVKERTIIFLDTPDFTLHGSGLVLRQRVKRATGKTEYTLKCRNEDRYLAAGRDLRAAEGLHPDEKLEEDIAVPFVSRFSHSNTVSFPEHKEPAFGKVPRTLREGALLFPTLLALRRDGLACAPETALLPVNHVKARELVYTGPELRFPAGGKANASRQATVALILWSKGKSDRPLAVEFSFRYGDEGEIYPTEAAEAARGFYEGLQQLHWSRADGMTKTQYVYMGANG